MEIVWKIRGRFISVLGLGAALFALALSPYLFTGTPDTDDPNYAAAIITWMVCLGLATLGATGGCIVWLIGLRQDSGVLWPPIVVFVAVAIAVGDSITLWVDSLDFSFYF